MTKEKFFTSVGWIGMAISVLMYVFYFAQIENNLAGNKGPLSSLSWPVSTAHYGFHTVCSRKNAICRLSLPTFQVLSLVVLPLLQHYNPIKNETITLFILQSGEGNFLLANKQDIYCKVQRLLSTHPKPCI